MSRNSSGVYTLPIAAFAAGGVIRASDHNSNYSDIATALTQSLATTGVSSMTGPIKAATGSVAAPGYAFSSDTATGFYLSGTHQVTFVCNGAAGVVFLNGGGVTFNGGANVTGALTVTGTITQSGASVITFAAGTALVFVQTAAPTGWTKVVTYNDYALRIVSGTVGTGGTKAFTTLFSASVTNLAAHSHSLTDPGHTHSFTGASHSAASGGGSPNVWISTVADVTGSATTGITMASSGTGASTAFDVQYVDAIIATKN